MHSYEQGGIDMKEDRIFATHLHDPQFISKYRDLLIQADSLIELSGREVESLSGLWKFTLDPYDTALRDNWPTQKDPMDSFIRAPVDFDIDAWEDMRVPSCWNLADPTYFWYEGSACYVRRFDFMPQIAERVFIAFEGISGDAYVFLNHKQIAYHRGGSTPFSCEVSDQLCAGRNELFVVVNNTRTDERVPMSNTDWFNYGGIYRDVYLVRLPITFIQRYNIRLDDRGGILVSIKTSSHDIQHNTQAPQNACHAHRASITPDKALIRIPELCIEQEFPVSQGIGSIHLNVEPELWSPEKPKLYEVELELAADHVRDRVGFRTIKKRGTEILLNGRPVFLRGVSYHEDNSRGGKTLTPTEVRHDLETAQALGCNFVRLAHYPHSRAAAMIADELGLMLWEEIPVYWGIDFANPYTADDAQNQLKELIARDANRASVIIWSVGNENPDTDERLSFMTALVDTAKEYDPTRLVSAACIYDWDRLIFSDRLAEHLDVVGMNEYLGWYDPDYEKLPRLLNNACLERPLIITEFGGGALAGHHGTVDELFTEERQCCIYERQIEAISCSQYVCGMTPWILFDFRCPRRTNRYQRFYNRKGLIDQDHHTRKMAFDTLRAYYYKKISHTTLQKDRE